ncbi:hypothetical protein GCM10025867_48650 (plasmid) [Frondihabitans sucicola]|uniref:Uncharacterized protein n=1 Tax=Frondihabitans sucicola TaxID=1268041 RepID=A0ABN6Y5P4_9MICO|nr:hypothetical protein [Frondihabitans sucicola]BDZ52624.1 hypothetical protein GCM10025867_48650 [Frondihabitans sucicola]
MTPLAVHAFDFPLIQGFDYGLFLLVLGVGGLLGIGGFIFTLSRINMQSERPVLESVGATAAFVAWLGLAVFYAHLGPQMQLDARVAAARVDVEKQLDAWTGDDQYLAQFGQQGLTHDEVEKLVAGMDLTHRPTREGEAVGHVMRAGQASDYNLLILHWESGNGYYISADEAASPAAAEKVLAALGSASRAS